VVEETVLKVVQSLTDCLQLRRCTMRLSKRLAKMRETTEDSLPRVLSEFLWTAS